MTHGSPELDADAAKLEAMGQDAGPHVEDFDLTDDARARLIEEGRAYCDAKSSIGILKGDDLRLITRLADALATSEAEAVRVREAVWPEEPTREMWAAMGNVLVEYRANPMQHHDHVGRRLYDDLRRASLESSRG